MTLRRALSRSLWSLYDSLGMLILANLLWFLLTLPFLLLVVLVSMPLFGEVPLAVYLAGAAAIFHNPAGLALAETAQRLAETDGASLGDFWRGLRVHFFRGMLLMTAAALISVALCASFLFYAGRVWSGLGLVGNMLAAGLTVWAFAFFAASACYWSPVAVRVEGDSPRVLFTLKRAALLTLESPLFTFGAACVTLIMAVFWLATVVGVPLMGMSCIRLFHAHARLTLHERREAAEAVSARGEAVTRRAVMEELRRKWAEEPKRRLRDLAKPWD